MAKYIIYFCVLFSLSYAYKSYTGYKVVETEILNEENVTELKTFITNPYFDFWTKPQAGKKARIMFAPNIFQFALSTLNSMDIKTNIIIADVEIVLEKERRDTDKASKSENSKLADFTKYYTFDEVLKFINDEVTTYPDIASVIEIGTSYEGRPMRVLKLSNGPGKTGMFFDSAMHAREWLTIPTVMYAIHELTENLSKNKAMLDKNDFYFLLVANPDGYAYTHEFDRLWRKTRSENPDSSCIGTDPNRNFDQNWNGTYTNLKYGVTNPCSSYYRGSAPFSEPEVASIAKFINDTTNITFGLSVHSCGQYLIYPFGNTTDLPPNVDELERVGKDALEALEQISGTKYTLGSTANLLYKAFATSTDWFYVKQGLSLSYTIELPCGEGPPDQFNFVSSTSSILPVAIETWEAYKVFAAKIPEKRIYFE